MNSALHHPQAELASPAAGKVLVQEDSLSWLIFFSSPKEKGLSSSCFQFDLISIKKTSTARRAGCVVNPGEATHPRRSVMTAPRRQLEFLLRLRSRFPLLFRLY